MSQNDGIGISWGGGEEEKQIAVLLTSGIVWLMDKDDFGLFFPQTFQKNKKVLFFLND